jgi:hypothetical protein
MDVEEIWRTATEIPEEWYESDHFGLDRLVENLYRRRGLIRHLIAAFRTSSRNPFPFGERINPDGTCYRRICRQWLNHGVLGGCPIGDHPYS